MSHSLSPSTSPVPSSPSIPLAHDFTDAARASGLATALQEAAQALLSYSQNYEPVPKKSIEAQAKQSPDSQKPSAFIPSRSNRIKRREKCQTFAFDRYAPDAFNDFADKELAKVFEKAYLNGNFRDEIRYYFVPAHIVKHEYRLLHYHQQNTVLDMLLGVHTELDIRSKLLAYLASDTCEQDILLAQVSESLLQTLQLLQTIHSHLNNLRLVHKTILPQSHNP